MLMNCCAVGSTAALPAHGGSLDTATHEPRRGLQGPKDLTHRRIVPRRALTSTAAGGGVPALASKPYSPSVVMTETRPIPNQQRLRRAGAGCNAAAIDFRPSMADQRKGLEPDGPPSWSTVNLLLPLQVADADKFDPRYAAIRVFALAHWALPRVPTIGEEVIATGNRLKVERVTWDDQGRAVVRFQEARLDPSALKALEQEGWTVSTRETEPPSDWPTR